ncbi:MAG: TauD/TfdA family dioxygenase [Rhodospirillaceae bacterium]|jgi:taurine dioxygenase
MNNVAQDTSYPFVLNRVGEAAGAEILGVDLSQPFDDDLRDAIVRALVANHILVFRDQDLTSEQQMAMTERFGTLERHLLHDVKGHETPQVHVIANVDENNNPIKRTYGSFHWHTDKSYHEIPSFATFLHARELPPDGGQTEFANMHLAYETLDDATKKQIEGLKAIHSWEANRRNTGSKPATPEEIKLRPPVVHPLVRTHPDNGRKALYIGIHTDCIEGMDREEGIALLKRLYDHATERRFVYPHSWRLGDLVMWDNRSLLHRVLHNYDMSQHRRVMHRSVVIGTRPE